MEIKVVEQSTAYFINVVDDKGETQSLSVNDIRGLRVRTPNAICVDMPMGFRVLYSKNPDVDVARIADKLKKYWFTAWISKQGLTIVNDAGERVQADKGKGGTEVMGYHWKRQMRRWGW